MTISILISLFLSFGFISSEADFNNLDQVQKDQYEAIIIDDSMIL